DDGSDDDDDDEELLLPPAGAGGGAAVCAEFNDMPARTQNSVLNELIQRHSSAATTALIFTTLQAPEPGTSDSEQRAQEYLGDIDALVRGLPPVFLVHATSLT
ncbi:hypothetical protein IWQ57_004600, partial [Coemansia nantahalensis]